MEQIRTYLESIAALSEQDWLTFSSRLRKRTFPKKTILLETGQTENYLSFIEEGIVRCYIPGEENDLTFAFIFTNSFVSAYDSFLEQSPSVYQMETLADTVLWSLTFNNLQDIYRETAIGNVIGRKAAEDLFLKKSIRELSLLKDSAEARYLQLFSEQPHLLLQVPLKYIASYIGITPQALSRIRKRIS